MAMAQERDADLLGVEFLTDQAEHRTGGSPDDGSGDWLVRVHPELLGSQSLLNLPPPVRWTAAGDQGQGRQGQECNCSNHGGHVPALMLAGRVWLLKHGFHRGCFQV